MSAPSSEPYFFVSYSRADIVQQRKIVVELRQRGVRTWVDTDNLVPGSPAWENEIERSIRGAAGVIVLLSPDSNNSQWVRRELSFSEEIDKHLFPVHIRGDENSSIPLRLSAHQRVDVRRNFREGMDQLAEALKAHLGITAIDKRTSQPAKASFRLPQGWDLRKLAWPAAVAFLGLLCIGGIAFATQAISNIDLPARVTATATTTPPGFDVTFTPTEEGSSADFPEPAGKIVYTCSLAGDEVCIINADGSGWQRLTNTNQANSNASLSPDGSAIVYISGNTGKSEIYELGLANRDTRQITELGQSVGAPEISPDNQHIIFHYRPGNSNVQLWIMNRDGSEPDEFYRVSGRDVHDATWSPDGTRILFALGRGENNQLYIMDFHGGEPELVNDALDTRGRSDWSAGNLISFDQGGPFMHDVYLMNTDGSNLRRVSKSGINAQGASLSPDGNWIAITAYTDVPNKDQNSCEIFIMRVDGTDMRQLTDNEYCDYQPRWGN